MSAAPLVSIVTTCYQHEPYLEDYFRGLLSQTYRNLELIVFDDGSTDGSWVIIEGYLPTLREQFARVVAERHRNMGFLKELALAVGLTRGQYVCILESDDYYLPRKIEENIEYLLSNPDVGLVHSDANFLYSDRIESAVNRKHRRALPIGYVYDTLLRWNFITTSTVCCRADLLKAHVNFEGYDRRAYLMGDYPMWLDMARNTRFGYIDRALTSYRVLQESASHSAYPRKAYRFWRSYMQIKQDYIAQYPPSTETKKAVCREFYEGLFAWGFRLRDKHTCLRGYRWLLRHYPREFGTVRNSIRASIVHNEVLWRCAIACEGRGYFGRSVSFLRSLASGPGSGQHGVLRT